MSGQPNKLTIDVRVSIRQQYGNTLELVESFTLPEMNFAQLAEVMSEFHTLLEALKKRNSTQGVAR
jgi:hypothetical protein